MRPIRNAAFLVTLIAAWVVSEAHAQPCPSSLSSDYFLPGKLLGPIRNMVADFLRSIDEPSLWCGGTKTNASYRISFPGRREGRSIRVDRSGGRATLVATTVTFAGPVKDPSRRSLDASEEFLAPSTSRQSRAIAPEVWQHISRLVSRARFWRLPEGDDRVVHDGALCLFEGRVGSRYRAVARWSPDQSLGEWVRAFESLADHGSLKAEE